MPIARAQIAEITESGGKGEGALFTRFARRKRPKGRS